MYLFDTDTCIRFLRGEPFILARVRLHTPGDIRIAILSVYELEVGLRKASMGIEKKRRAYEKMLGLFPVVPFGRKEACEAAQIRAELEQAGTPIGSIDYLIAGVARTHGWTLVTGNLDEFRRVTNLRIEKWHE